MKDADFDPKQHEQLLEQVQQVQSLIEGTLYPVASGEAYKLAEMLEDVAED